MADADQKKRIVAHWSSDLRPNEKLIAYYCTDGTSCGCVAYEHGQVSCTPIARGTGPDGPYDRCLQCGACWRSKAWADEPTEVIADPGKSSGVVSGQALARRGSKAGTARRLLAEGKSRAEVAAAIGVSTRRLAGMVHKWETRGRAA